MEAAVGYPRARHGRAAERRPGSALRLVEQGVEADLDARPGQRAAVLVGFTAVGFPKAARALAGVPPVTLNVPILAKPTTRIGGFAADADPASVRAATAETRSVSSARSYRVTIRMA